MSRKKQRQKSNPEPQELAVAEQDVLSFSFLQRNGIEIERPFSRDILLMTTRVNGTSYIENIHELAASVKEGEAASGAGQSGGSTCHSGQDHGW